MDPSWNVKNKDTLKKKEFWYQDAYSEVTRKLLVERNYFLAKNIIFFIGDGMSVPTVTAGRIYEGQLKGIIGERNRLEFEKFEHVGLSKTYCADRQVADSACTASAYLCGAKANYRTIGVSADVKLDDCAAAKKPSNQLSSIAEWALRAHKSAGLVTTTRVTHASPSGLYAHTSNRDFESDFDVKDLGQNPANCPDIADQLVTGEVVTDKYGKKGQRLDGRNLIDEWKKNKRGRVHTVFDRTELSKINPSRTDYLLGLFNSSHLAYNLDDSIDTPSLSEMTAAAIKVLSNDPAGYFLFVEGGRIDHAHHETKAKKALDETAQFSAAVKRALQMTNPWETLIVVSADHGHTMTINGYPDINNSITGLNSELSDKDNKPFATLSYANGADFEKFFTTNADGKVERVDLTNANIGHKDTIYPHGVPMAEETHGGGDVAVYANGPWAHLFTGVYEQSTLPHLMAYASCIGPGTTYCSLRPRNPYLH
ncbi:alkaline phosphatase, tissue-nonspecific isozyme [Drosophila busckii]|uniref:alkaline phosphatase, tissue-nonspecific isozyme n=1 Tax=Drosophila busckii TaxID=30019 RepID=UPI00083EDD9F|nr:alkaline phosphatase, tissue-nonspecific isozyme [Drosophila busckii]